jgi:hypothetical protein
MLFFLGGRQAADATERPLLDLPPCYPYVAILILSASAANVRAPWFYAGASVLAAWALWAARPRRSSPLLWTALLLSAIGFGYLGHLGLHALQGQVETVLIRWMTDSAGGADADPARSHTAIGRIGTLKLSDTILFRVKLPAGEPALLLHDASYTRYGSAVWSAGDPDAQTLQPDPDGTTWPLGDGYPARRLTILAPLRAGQGTLALPAGTTRITGLRVGRLERTRLGVVRASQGPTLVEYQTAYSPERILAAPPDAADLVVPARELAVLSRVAGESGVSAEPPRQALQALAQFFHAHFRYSLTLQDPPRGVSPLEDFLLRTRSGHCELFATATVLLLRQAGIPARYATGYLVHEFSRLEQRHVVRARHAHAWALAYVDGAWHTFDTTPDSWATVEAAAASWWAPIADLWSWGALQASWWWLRSEGTWRLGLSPWLLIPLGGFLAWRWYASGRPRQFVQHAPNTRQAPPWPGADSEFYLLEGQMEGRGLGRRSWEPIGAWLRRLDDQESLPVNRDALRAAASLHARYRFDPEGISPADRKRLSVETQSLLAQLTMPRASSRPLASTK